MVDLDEDGDLEIVGATHVSAAPADVDAYGGLEPMLVAWPGAEPAEVAAKLGKRHRTAGGTG